MSKISRRDALKYSGMLAASAAAAVTAGALFPAAAAPNSDATLIALEREYWDTTGETCTVQNEYDAITMPKRPDILYWPGYFYEPGWEVLPDDPRAPFTTRHDIDRFFTGTAPTLWRAGAPEEIAARHQETLVAFDKYEAECVAAKKHPRAVELARRIDALGNRAEEILRKIIATPAAGPAGFAVKLRLGTNTLFEPEQRASYLKGECKSMDDAALMSALIDCERMARTPYPSDAAAA
ncbi:MAG: hypothetical protein IH626_17610 [Rhodospirillales bacterium]|nr:hypothetical protein [Rhodospirillales bacterium]